MKRKPGKTNRIDSYILLPAYSDLHQEIRQMFAEAGITVADLKKIVARFDLMNAEEKRKKREPAARGKKIQNLFPQPETLPPTATNRLPTDT